MEKISDADRLKRARDLKREQVWAYSCTVYLHTDPNKIMFYLRSVLNSQKYHAQN